MTDRQTDKHACSLLRCAAKKTQGKQSTNDTLYMYITVCISSLDKQLSDHSLNPFPYIAELNLSSRKSTDISAGNTSLPVAVIRGRQCKCLTHFIKQKYKMHPSVHPPGKHHILAVVKHLKRTKNDKQATLTLTKHWQKLKNVTYQHYAAECICLSCSSQREIRHNIMSNRYSHQFYH